MRSAQFTEKAEAKLKLRVAEKRNKVAPAPASAPPPESAPEAAPPPEAAPEAAPPPEAEPRLQVRGAAATEKVGEDAGDAEVQLESKGALQLDIVKNIEHVTDCEDSHPELMRSMYVYVSLYLC